VGYTVCTACKKAQNIPRPDNTISSYGGHNCYYGKQLNDGGSITSSRNRSCMPRCSEENEYPYSESDVPKMLHKLLKKGLIELPEAKRLEEVGRADDPKY